MLLTEAQHAMLRMMPARFDDMIKETGFTNDGVKLHLKKLKGHRLCFVVRWERARGVGPMLPVYTRGGGRDARKPRSLTNTEKMRRKRANRKARDLIAASLRKGPFAALFQI